MIPVSVPFVVVASEKKRRSALVSFVKYAVPSKPYLLRLGGPNPYSRGRSLFIMWKRLGLRSVQHKLNMKEMVMHMFFG